MSQKKQIMEQQNLIDPFELVEKEERLPIDEWQPTCPEDEVFKTVRGAIIVGVSECLHLDDPEVDRFVMNPKRSYNSNDMRAHTVQYLNYFEKYYDKDRELVAIYSVIKSMIDGYPDCYGKEAFIYDLNKYIMNGNIRLKASFLVNDCYSLNLTYKNLKNPNLQYSD